jgi:uncharacterized protein involved in type VI secretion and phage assembly
MRNIPGVVIGIVVSLEDPDGMGRIKLSFPWMSDGEPLSNWARIAAPMAGAERGVQFMPEIDDEVLVAFDQGDLRFPFVVGFLWNGTDKPPEQEPARRVIKTVSGHTLTFDDTEGEEKVSIETAGGHRIALDDGGAEISISFNGGEPSITLQQDSVVIKEGSNSIEFSSEGIEIKGSEITLEASQSITLEASQIKLNA